MNRSLFYFLLILLFTVVFSYACDKDGEENPDVVTIEYTLTSEEAGKTADIEYTSGIGIIVLEDKPLPWSISFKAIFKLGDALTFNAESGDEGEMTAQIIVDDKVVTSETATFIIQLDYIKGLK